MTAAEVPKALGKVGAQLAADLVPGLLLGKSATTEDDLRMWRASKRRDRIDVDQRIWSLTLGLPQEELAAVLGVPDVQFTWPKTGTTVNAYRLGSSHGFFVGLIDGRAGWIRSDYPGLILQAKLAAQRQANTQK